VQVSSRNQTGLIATSTSPLTIGGDALFSGQFFAGLIDDVRVYNRALSVTEITTDMNTAVGAASGQSQTLLAGDFDENKVVDAGDYVFWRKQVDAAQAVAGGAASRTVTADGYEVWRANFGATASTEVLQTSGGALAVNSLFDSAGATASIAVIPAVASLKSVDVVATPTSATSKVARTTIAATDWSAPPRHQPHTVHSIDTRDLALSELTYPAKDSLLLTRLGAFAEPLHGETPPCTTEIQPSGDSEVVVDFSLLKAFDGVFAELGRPKKSPLGAR
jgi:concanavalin A-like lectin/glucanase superfamily protein